MRGQRVTYWGAVAGLAVVTACSGHPVVNGAVPDGGAPGSTAGALCPPFAPIPRRIWRLSVAQISTSVRDLLGIPAGPSLAAGGDPADAFIADDTISLDPALALSLDGALDTIFAAAAPVLPALAACQAAESEDDCARRFARSFGLRAFRRPLDDDEVTDLLAAYAEGRQQDFTTGISTMIEALLLAPSFLFRTELGAASDAPTALTPFEVASQLSYTLTNSTPDAPLLAAAADGRLSTPEGTAAEVDRLLATAAVQQNLDRVVGDWFGTRGVYAVAKDPALGLTIPDQLLMAGDLYDSARRFIDDTLWSGPGKVTDLLTSGGLFVNQRLATMLGVPFGGALATDFEVSQAQAGQRAGMLTQPAVLWAISGSATTGVVHRGGFVRASFVCGSALPDPPDLHGSVETQAQLMMLPSETGRSALELNDAVCAACHAQLNPFGLVLEGFDPVGRLRATADGVPVDPTGDFASAAPLPGRITGPAAFARAAVADGQFTACAAQHLVSYTLGRAVSNGITCEAQALGDGLEGAGGTMTALMRQVAIAPFVRARAGGAP